MKFRPSVAPAILVEDDKTSRIKKHLKDLENLVGWLKTDVQELDKDSDSTLGKVGAFFLGTAVGSSRKRESKVNEDILPIGVKIRQVLKNGTIRYGKVVSHGDTEDYHIGTRDIPRESNWTGIVFDGEDEDEIGWFQNDEWKQVGISKA